MPDTKIILTALVGAATLGSMASLAVPTRMAIHAEDSAVGGLRSAAYDPATPAFYVEPGPQDLAPAIDTASSVPWQQAAWTETDPAPSYAEYREPSYEANSQSSYGAEPEPAVQIHRGTDEPASGTVSDAPEVAIADAPVPQVQSPPPVIVLR